MYACQGNKVRQRVVVSTQKIRSYRSGGNEEGESGDGLHGAGLDYSKGSDDAN